MPPITVTAKDTASAMEDVFEQLGDDAYIIETTKKNGVQIIPMNITLDQQKKGQLFDFLIRLPETQ